MAYDCTCGVGAYEFSLLSHCEHGSGTDGRYVVIFSYSASYVTAAGSLVPTWTQYVTAELRIFLIDRSSHMDRLITLDYQNG